MADGGRELRFTLFEEAVLHLQEHIGPWNIQAEVGSTGRIDADRLREAVRGAVARHPMLRARLNEHGFGDSAYRWTVVEDPDDGDLVSEADCADDPALDDLRTDFYSPPISLEAVPPLRVAIAHRPGGDLALFDISHVPADGIAVHRFLQSVTRAYRGEDDPADPVDLDEARAVDRHLAPQDLKEAAGRALEGLRRVGEALDPPSRLAKAGVDGREGFGFVHHRLDPEQTKALLANRPEGATLNDVLLAALHLAIDRWNAEHGEDAGRVGTIMPMNTRPKDWFWDVVANFAAFVNVSTSAGDRDDLASATAAVAKQTSPVYRVQRAGGTYDLLRLLTPLPVGVKRLMPSLLPLTGNRFIDSAVLSNLGKLPDPPRFEGDAPPEIWFSPPCAMPLGVGIGVATAADSIHLVVRHRFEQFGRDEARAFADLFLEQVNS
jgi:NRPS condensation-like uncharacterized protein